MTHGRRKPTLTHHQQQEAIKRLKAGKETQGQIARSCPSLEMVDTSDKLLWEQEGV